MTYRLVACTGSSSHSATDDGPKWPRRRMRELPGDAATGDAATGGGAAGGRATAHEPSKLEAAIARRQPLTDAKGHLLAGR